MSAPRFPAATAAGPSDIPTRPSRAVAALSTWPLVAVAFASTSVIVGVVWDISWHRSIGRDSFWTPAHMAIYLGGVVAGLSCGWVVLRTTFAGGASERAGAVSFWGFRGPLGAWICIWGALAMIASAPLDDWWHNAYGLDVEILSPPHMVLAFGINAICIGAMLLVLARQNGAPAGARLLQGLFIYTCGFLILQAATVFMEYIAVPNLQHGPRYFFTTAALVPFLLVGIARGSTSRWGATGAAGVYMGTTMLMIWILQLFPAQPMLAPIMRQVDHMVPPFFPILLVAPAFVIDLVVNRTPAATGRLRWGVTAACTGIAAMLALTAVQWPFAQFLLTEPARNFFFAADQFDYNRAPGPYQYVFWGRPMTAGFSGWTGLIAAVSGVAGLWWGNWMARVRR